jgi:hypothetical protein
VRLISFLHPPSLLTLLKELLINSYFNIVKREMIDMVPKAITLTLVNHSKENLQRELLQELYKPDVLDELLKESEYVITRRKEVVSMVSALNKAEEYVFFQLRKMYDLHADYPFPGLWLVFDNIVRFRGSRLRFLFFVLTCMIVCSCAYLIPAHRNG